MSDASGPLVLTVDVGSSSLRTDLYTSDAKALEGTESQLHYDVKLTPDGGAEIDPAVLLDTLRSAIEGTLHSAGREPLAIKAAGMCSLVGNVLGIDAQGKPTTPIYTWADTRCAAEVEQLRKDLDDEAVYERTGCPLHTSYLPARLLWIKRVLPDAYERTACWISLSEWLHLNLLGKYAQSLSVASWNGLLNRHTLTWDADLLSYLGVGADKLPALVDVGEQVGTLAGEYAEKWPALREAVWYPCVGDGVTSNIGCGCLDEQDLAVQVGTSGAIRAIVAGGPEAVPRGLWCYRVDRQAALVGGALSEGGNVLDWLHRTLNIPDFPALELAASKLAPDSHGLTMLPFLAGERSPGWSGGARAVISGLFLDTSPPEIFRAAQEAIAYRFAAVYALLKPVLPPTRRIVASGGALLMVPGWAQILADVLGHEVTASGEHEASSRGVALLALRSLGLAKDFASYPPEFGETFKPDGQRHAIYARAMERQQALYRDIVG